MCTTKTNGLGRHTIQQLLRVNTGVSVETRTHEIYDDVSNVSLVNFGLLLCRGDLNSTSNLSGRFKSQSDSSGITFDVDFFGSDGLLFVQKDGRLLLETSFLLNTVQ